MGRKSPILLLLAAAACSLVLAPPGVSASPPPLDAALLQALNAARTAHGVRPLRLASSLTLAARYHSAEMLRGNYFRHGNFTRRMADFHVGGGYYGENLAWGTGRYAQADAVISEWLHSPHHRAVMLDPNFVRVGVGTAKGRFLGYSGAVVVTVDFAGG